MQIKYGVIFFIILIVATYTRLYGNNWDQGQHLNPDERFLTMVATEIEWPESLTKYLDTSTSKLNPHNTKFDFYVYGTWPVILIKFIAEQLNMGTYGNLTLVGRAMSGLTDLFTLVFVFLIGKRIGNTITGLFSMFVYAVMALPIQLSHFYTTDPYLTLFLTISLYILLFSPSRKTGILLGLSTGFALSAKISGVLIFPVIGISIVHFLAYKIRNTIHKTLWITIKRELTHICIYCLLFTIFFFLSFRLLMPYLFTNSGPISLNPKVLHNWETLKNFNDPNAWFPPGVQWINQKKIIDPFLNLFFIGLGLPLGITCIAGLIWSFKRLKTHPELLLLIFYTMLIFFYQGSQFVFPVRYFWPIYPVLASISGLFLYNLYKKYNRYILYGICFLLIVWPLSVISIYSRPHTRVTASEWIYQHIPSGSRLSREHWDDPVPLNFPGYIGSILYEGEELPMYYEDTSSKWKEIMKKVERLDYIILSSNRVYGSITSAPNKYPETTNFYETLFSGELGFKKVAEFTSRPSLPFPINLCIHFPFFKYGRIDGTTHNCTGIEFIDDYVEESWTVYDHPKVTIFKNISS